ncbi:MAG TPA: Gfo/Idh/MocA family oxidoreductase [Planctomycetota bacterium]|nr:Gfo/Idh/MocA family oxidoreductase [Planctomycetota bacterium]
MHRTTRRSFLRSASALAVSTLAFPAVLRGGVIGSDQKLNIAGIGVGGKGESDIQHCSSENVIALCDVDEANAANSFKRFPDAKRYKDYRKMLDEEGKRIDAVTVSTPDHHHAPASIRAMRLGKHVYCQKPLTHTVAEARLMADVAREMKVATQMGNQGMSHPRTRRMVEIVRAGVLGNVKEVHIWTDRPIWPQGIDRPKDAPPVPPSLDWDLWLGPAPERPYHPAYVPFKWRGFWDFGTGALGDMGCHNMALSFWALDLRDPISVEAVSSPVNSETAPSRAMITYQFPALGSRPALMLTWYDGGLKPSRYIVKGQDLQSNGAILIGDKDTLLVQGNRGGGGFQSGARMDDFKDVPQTIPRRSETGRDNDLAHRLEWIEAAKGGAPASSNFPERAGPLAEAVLLGNLALRAGKKIEWDAKCVKVTNAPEANQFVRCTYRSGWEV